MQTLYIGEYRVQAVFHATEWTMEDFRNIGGAYAPHTAPALCEATLTVDDTEISLDA